MKECDMKPTPNPKPITLEQWASKFVPTVSIIDPQLVADRKAEMAHRDYLLGR